MTTRSIIAQISKVDYADLKGFRICAIGSSSV
jgi:hypothetical protein